MNELIKIAPAEINGVQVQTVNARDIHSSLEIKKDFSTWVKAQIERGGFEENVDYVKTQYLRSPSGGSTKSRPQTVIDYHFSLSSAKHIAMMSNSEKGKQVRDYFIRCEQELKEVKAQQFKLPDFTNPAIAARAWAEQFEKAQALQMKVETDKPLVEFAETIQESNEDFLIRKAAKMLGVKVKFLFCFLREQQWIFKTSSEPYARRIHQGLMTVKVGDYKDKDGEQKHSITGYLTFKGLKRLHDDLKSLGKIPQEHQLELNI